MTALIVDDTSIIRMLLKDVLVEFCGLSHNSIHEARDGRRGLDMYKKIQPDIVFLDIAMPNLNGIDAVKALMEIDPHAHIVMCTSSGSRGIVKECVKAGAKDYLIKPLIPARVVIAVNKARKPEKEEHPVAAAPRPSRRSEQELTESHAEKH